MAAEPVVLDAEEVVEGDSVERDDDEVAELVPLDEDDRTEVVEPEDAVVAVGVAVVMPEE